MVGVTAALLVGLASVSLAREIGGSAAPAIETMGVSLAGVVGMASALATLLVARRRGVGIALYAISLVIGVGFLVWAGRRVPVAPTLVLSPSDRTPLREFHDETSDLRGIEHPALGFRLPHPTLALEPSAELEEETRRVAAPGWLEAHQIWAFETHDRGVSIVIDLSRAEHADSAALASFDRAVTGPLEAGGHRVERAAPAGSSGCLRESFHAQLTNGGVVDGCLFAFDEGVRSLRLVVTVVSDGAGDWAGWIEGASLACERSD